MEKLFLKEKLWEALFYDKNISQKRE